MHNESSYGNTFSIPPKERFRLMYYEKVELCGVNTSTLKVLSSEEKRELLLLAKNGDFCAREKLMYGNLRLVLSIIKRFSNRNENPDDLFQVGCIGLIKAIDNFNTDLDVKFSTYAVPMVIECRNPRKDFYSYDQKNRIITGYFATLWGR